jgi:hypothetical protein
MSQLIWIPDNSITTAKIRDAQITKAKMADTGRAFISELNIYNLDTSSYLYNAGIILHSGWTVLKVEVYTYSHIYSDTSQYWTLTLYTIDTANTTVNRGSITIASTSDTLKLVSGSINSFTVGTTCRTYYDLTKTSFALNLFAIVRMIIAPTDTLYG